MLSFYHKEGKSYKLMAENIALEYNEKGKNIYIAFDQPHKIYENNNYVEGIEKHVPITKIGDFNVVLFSETEIGKVGTNQVTKLLKRCIGDQSLKQRLPYGKVRDGARIKQEITRGELAKTVTLAHAKFLQGIAKKAFREHSSDFKEETYIITVNDAVKVENIDIDMELKGKDIIYNTKHNFLVDFSREKHNLSGPPYDVLFAMHKGIKIDTLDYIEKNFGIEYKDLEYVEMHRVEIDESQFIVYTNKNVFKEGIDASGNAYKKVLFKSAIEPLGVTYSKFDIDVEKLMDKKMYYFIVNMIDHGVKTQVALSSYPDKKSFNRQFVKIGLAFRGQDMDLFDFYDSMRYLNHDGKTPTMKTIYQNGFHQEEKIFVHGGNIVRGDPKDIYCVAPEYDLSDRRTQKGLQEGLEALKQIYNKDVVNVLYLWMLGAMSKDIFSMEGMEKIKYPFLIVSGVTGCGKTTLIDKLRGLFEFSDSARKLSLGGTTQQPILYEARDKIPIYFDEYTGDVKSGTDDTLRGFYDELTDKKGRPGGNEEFIKRASLIISGERMPVALSVINRSILIPAKNKYRKGNQVGLSYLNTISIVDSWREVISKVELATVIRQRKDINETIFFHTENARLDDTYRTIILLNRFFDVVNEEELKESIKYVLMNHKRYMNAMDEEIKMITSAMSSHMQYSPLEMEYTLKNDHYENVILILPLAGRRGIDRHKMDIVAFAEKYCDNFKAGIDLDLSLLRISMDKIEAGGKKSLHNNILALMCGQKIRNAPVRGYLESVGKISAIDGEMVSNKVNQFNN